jgi:uncharacterized protein with PIN domain
MTRIYIDTNVFLDFYQAATDRLAVFQDLVRRADKVILTEQTVREFKRNRITRLTELARNIERGGESNIMTTAVIRELPQFKSWVQARDAARCHAKAIAQQLRLWVIDETSDVVLTEFANLAAAATHLPTTEMAIERARRRKLLGEPPTSPDRHTIGDELIWETLLAGCQEDLIVVSRDRTFLDNTGLLKSEYEATGYRRLILVTQNLSDALAKIGAPSDEIATQEKAIQARRPADSATESDICPRCGGQLEEIGFEGAERGKASGFYCTRCGLGGIYVGR